MLVADGFRFGEFRYETFEEVPDPRSRRYLPEEATAITIHKIPNGYFARYELSNEALGVYLDSLWEEFGQYSAVKRGGFSDEGEIVNCEVYEHQFSQFGWNCPNSAVVYHSPSEGDGGGATYYVDATTNRVTQRTCFW